MTGKVAWKEGLALLPQHFQRADEALREDLHRQFGQPPSRGFGFSKLRLDDAALPTGGLFGVLACAGVFPGGFRFDTEQGGSRMLQRQIPEGLGLDIPRLRVYLAMPAPTDGAANLGPHAAFGEFPVQLPDSATGRSRREVLLAYPNLTLRFSTEANDGFIILPICDLVRGRQGQAMVADDFAPTVLDIHVWPAIQERLGRLCDTIQLRVGELERQNPAVDAQGMRQWLECVHLRTQLTLLDGMKTTQEIHPFQLFQALLALAGGLVFTRAMETPPADYIHAEMSRCVLVLFQRLFQSLANEISTDNLVKLMTKEAPVLFSIQLPPENWKGGKRFYLAIRTGLQVDQLVTAFGHHAKVAPRTKLQAIITSALPGIDARMSPPPAFFRATGQICFEMSTNGPLWQSLLEEGFVGVYTPPNLDISAIELLIEGG